MTNIVTNNTTDTATAVKMLREDYFCLGVVFVSSPKYGSIIRPETEVTTDQLEEAIANNKVYTYRTINPYVKIGSLVLINGFKLGQVVETYNKPQSIEIVLESQYDIKFITGVVTREMVKDYNEAITIEVKLAKEINGVHTA